MKRASREEERRGETRRGEEKRDPETTQKRTEEHSQQRDPKALDISPHSSCPNQPPAVRPP